MPIATIELTDTFDQWRQKDNLMVGLVNSLSGSGTVLSISSQSAGQLLISDGSTFRNVTVSGDFSIDSSGVASIVGGTAGLTKGRIRFAGSISGLY